MKEAVSMLMLRYPSRLGNLFIVNSGLVVYYLWQAVSLLLAQVRITGLQTSWGGRATSSVLRLNC